MTARPDLLEHIDGCIRELEAIRAAVAASLPAEDGDGSNRTISADPANDLADGNLLDTSSATPRPSRVRIMCRSGCSGS